MAAPHLYYLEDRDGDRKADRIEVVFTGFGDHNVQAVPNNLRWALDNWFSVAGGQNGGLVRALAKPDMPAVSIVGRDFRFRPTGVFEPLSGGDRWGNSFDGNVRLARAVRAGGGGEDRHRGAGADARVVTVLV